MYCCWLETSLIQAFTKVCKSVFSLKNASGYLRYHVSRKETSDPTSVTNVVIGHVQASALKNWTFALMNLG